MPRKKDPEVEDWFSRAGQPPSGSIYEPHVAVEMDPLREPGHYYLRNLAVGHQHRGQGIGTDFMRRLLARHDEAGSTITLHVGEKRTDLKKWYGSMGFEHEADDAIGTRMTRRAASRTRE